MKTRIVLGILWGLSTLIACSTSESFYLGKPTNFDNLESLMVVGFKISIFACFWVFVLTRNDMIFGWWKSFLYNLVDLYRYKDGKLDAERSGIAEDLLKPILTCEICVGAHIGFWIYVSMSRIEFVLIDFLFLIAFTSLVTLLTTETWQKTTN